MKAILVNDDRSLRWDEVPNPVLGAEDCMVKIEAAALNRADLMQREGDYPPPAGCPEWMGPDHRQYPSFPHTGDEGAHFVRTGAVRMAEGGKRRCKTDDLQGSSDYRSRSCSRYSL